MGKNCAIIVAAGKGKRMKTSICKQFLNLREKPVLYYTLHTFSKSELIDEIILVTLEDKIDYCVNNIIEKYDINKVTHVIAGGKERQDSVYSGLRKLPKDCNIVLIHDAARPFISEDIINNGIKYAEMYGACTCGVSPKDTIKVKNSKNFSSQTLNREDLFIVQTPQCFRYDIILDCHEKLRRDNIKVTDDTMVVERYNNSVYLYQGSYDNIKITTPEDLIIGEKILDNLA
ncbi:2-C-methyl-D-erythritol 4-phosphate cytidylyltransferase [Clostridium niameyense]|uniref:2-C-methyl-D-erythritol 4-phosphate cytidylyltransferase n=1 Tax=Clostridium niameyense TaxID=1622073 RepID=UPI00067F48AE|nr:2-C-methyl-D-erythritol 4-phosphate cytidylyltransferase [Clostridium niameyense]